MKKLVPLPLIFCSFIASADWVKIDHAADTAVKKLIDLKTIRQTGPMNTMRRVWEISNLSKRAANKAMSVKHLVEYDCKDRRIRLLEEQFFPEHGALGERIDTTDQKDQVGDWSGFSIGSITETIFNRVCPNDGT